MEAIGMDTDYSVRTCSSIYEDALTFYFVIDDTLKEISEEMDFAYQKIDENFSDESIKRIAFSECLQMPLDNLTRKNIFVVETFAGAVFEYLQSSKALILGPRAAINCLMSEKPLPYGHTIFTMAMCDMVVTTTGFPTNERLEIEKLVKYMGGRFTLQFIHQTTHLIAKTVKSEKYEKAAILKIPVMQPNYVQAVWDDSKCSSISGRSSQYDRYRLPLFYMLNISSTGIGGSQKSEISALINKHGGKYHGTFRSPLIDILILTRDQKIGEKYKAAKTTHTDCLAIDWIFDSVQMGYALPFNEYRVDLDAGQTGPTISTPTRKQAELKFSADLSSVTIDRTVDETQSSISSGRSTRSSARYSDNQQPSTSNRPTYKLIVQSINVKTVKAAGPFLDGCCIYLCGFTAGEKEKLSKILNNGSATRYDLISSDVTHVLVGGPTDSDNHELAKHCIDNLVTISWLMESIRLKQPAPVDNYLYTMPAKYCKPMPMNPSPASKRMIQSMSSTLRSNDCRPRRLAFDAAEQENNPPDPNYDSYEDEESILLSQYTLKPQPQIPSPPKKSRSDVNIQAQPPPLPNPEPVRTLLPLQFSESISSTDRLTQNRNFLNGLLVHVHGFDDEYTELYESQCREAGAALVGANYKMECDYIICPMDIFEMSNLKVRGKHLVNEYWFEEAYEDNKIPKSIEYYHNPIVFPNTDCPKLFIGMQFSISTYTGSERKFISNLCTLMGGKVEEAYARFSSPILICPDGTEGMKGEKFNAAIRWKLPVVTVKWVNDCCRSLKKLPLEDYIIGPNNPDVVKIPSTISNVGSVTGHAGTSSTSNDLINRLIDDRDESTPTQLRHRRLFEVAGSAYKTMPVVSHADKDCDKSKKDYLMNLSTPTRELLKESSNAFDNETPETRDRRLAYTSAGIRYWETPVLEQEEEERWKKSHFIPSRFVSPPSTPFDVIKRRMWKEALGDKYISPSQDYLTHKASQPNRNNNSKSNDNMFEDGDNRDELEKSAPVASTHVKRLFDLIQNRRTTSPVRTDVVCCTNEDIPETVPDYQQVDSVSITGDDMMIDWQDSCEFDKRKREMDVKPKPSNHKSGPLKFIISSSDNAVRTKLCTQIEQLNGVVDDDSDIDEVTHYLFERPNQGQKIFSAIAAGKWVLTLQYVEDSMTAGYFINEEPYEWGNPNYNYLAELNDSEAKTATAAHRWRVRLENQMDIDKCGKRGIFSDFRIILHQPVAATQNFIPLIKAGHGIILKVSEPFALSEIALNATHCFIQKGKQLTNRDYKALQNAKVLILNIMSLREFIIAENPDINKFIVPNLAEKK